MDVSAISVGKALTGGSTTVCYKIPTGYVAKWNLMYLHNTSGSTASVTAQWYDLSNTTAYDILSGYSMGSKEYLKFDGGAYVVLDEGDEVRITPANGSTFSVINTFELIRKK